MATQRFKGIGSIQNRQSQGKSQKNFSGQFHDGIQEEKWTVRDSWDRCIYSRTMFVCRKSIQSAVTRVRDTYLVIYFS